MSDSGASTVEEKTDTLSVWNNLGIKRARFVNVLASMGIPIYEAPPMKRARDEIKKLAPTVEPDRWSARMLQAAWHALQFLR